MNTCQVLHTFWGFVIRWWFPPQGGVFYIPGNPTSNAHLYQWRTEMYPQEKRHKYNTLSFLNNRSDSKRFSLSSLHPNPLLCCRPWAGPGNRTRQVYPGPRGHGTDGHSTYVTLTMRWALPWTWYSMNSLNLTVIQLRLVQWSTIFSKCLMSSFYMSQVF